MIAELSDEEINWIRRNFQIPSTTNDEEIRNIAIGIMNSQNRNLRILVGNEIEQQTLFKQAGNKVFQDHDYIIKYSNGLTQRFDVSLLRTCNDLFIHGFYGPCCIWARTCLEYLLQELCLEDDKVLDEIKEKIRQPEKNPTIKDMKGALAHRLSIDDKNSICILQNNGDAVTHHRYEILSTNKKYIDYRMGIADAKITIGKGINVKMPDERKTHELNRESDERERARESLKEIYFLILNKRGESLHES